MRAFPVALPSGVKYWTVLDEELVVVGDADAFLRHLRFGRDGSELTTRSYAGGHRVVFAVVPTDRPVVAGGGGAPWPVHDLVAACAAGGERPGCRRRREVLAGPGRPAVRGARRINGVLTAVRGFIVHAVTTGTAPGRAAAADL